MKKIIKLNPADEVYSELREMPNLVHGLKHTNAEDIKTIRDLYFRLQSIKSEQARVKLLNILSDSLPSILERTFSKFKMKNPNNQLSFGPRPGDLYKLETEPVAYELVLIDEHSERITDIFADIEIALDLLNLLSKPQRLEYLKALNTQISGINNPKELEYLTIYQKREYLKIMLIMDYRLTAVHILSAFPANKRHQHELVAMLFSQGNETKNNLALMRNTLSQIARDYHYPEAQLALALMSEGESAHESFIQFVQDSHMPIGDDKVIQRHLISVMRAIKDNKPIPRTPTSISFRHSRELYLKLFVYHLANDYKDKVCELVSTTGENRNCSSAFFKNSNTCNSNLNLSSTSSLSEEQIAKIHSHIALLHKEISGVLPFTNKARKAKKIEGLEALLIKAETMEAHIALAQIEKQYPGIRYGKLSHRTASLLDQISGEGTKLAF